MYVKKEETYSYDYEFDIGQQKKEFIDIRKDKSEEASQISEEELIIKDESEIDLKDNM